MTFSQQEPIVVVCAADDNYAMPLATTICSIVKNLDPNREIIFFIIDGGIKEFNKTKILQSLKGKSTITWLQPSNCIVNDKMKTSGHITIASYYRLLIPQLLPLHFTKAIYLDSDLIVNEDLGKLWDINISDRYLLAVQCSGIPYVSSPWGVVKYKEQEIPADCKYFNAGVLVINLEKWRNDNIALRVINYAEKNKQQMHFHDQEALNAVLAGQWGELDPRWNQTPSIYNFASWQDTPFSEDIYNSVIHHPYIVHFASSVKPWNSRERYPGKELFFNYLDMTAWSGWRYTLYRRIWKKFLKLKIFGFILKKAIST